LTLLVIKLGYRRAGGIRTVNITCSISRSKFGKLDNVSQRSTLPIFSPKVALVNSCHKIVANLMIQMFELLMTS